MATQAEEAVQEQDASVERLLPVAVAAIEAALAVPPETLDVATPPPGTEAAVKLAIVATLISMLTAAARRRGSPPSPKESDQIEPLAETLAPQVTDEAWQWAVEYARSLDETGGRSAVTPEKMTAQSKRLARTLATRTTAESALALAHTISMPFKVWISRGDGSVRSTHRTLHGYPVPMDKPFRQWPTGQVLDFPGDPRAPLRETVNCRCIAPTTRVRFGTLVALLRRPFDGHLIEVIYGERSVRLTTEHPVLTETGWKPAGSIRPGDYITSVLFSENALGSPEVDDMQPTAEQLWDALSFTARSERIPRGRVDLYGHTPDHDVDAQILDTPLPYRDLSQLCESAYQFRDAYSESQVRLQSSAMALGTISHLPSHELASTGVSVVLSQGLRDPLSDATPDGIRDGLGRHPRIEESQDLLFGDTSAGAVVLGEVCPPGPTHPGSLDRLVDGGDAPPSAVGHLLHGESLFVEVNEVLPVRYVGHVYDLSTVEGIFSAEDIVTKNCMLIFAETEEGVAEALAPADLDKAFALAASLDAQRGFDD